MDNYIKKYPILSSYRKNCDEIEITDYDSEDMSVLLREFIKINPNTAVELLDINYIKFMVINTYKYLKLTKDKEMVYLFARNYLLLLSKATNVDFILFLLNYLPNYLQFFSNLNDIRRAYLDIVLNLIKKHRENNEIVANSFVVIYLLTVLSPHEFIEIVFEV